MEIDLQETKNTLREQKGGAYDTLKGRDSLHGLLLFLIIMQVQFQHNFLQVIQMNEWMITLEA